MPQLSARPMPSRALVYASAAFGVAALGHLISTRRRLRETFRGRSVLITGGSRGLGLALAREFAAEGAHLILTARSREQLDAARQLLTDEYGVQVTTLVGDVRDEASVADVVAAAVSSAGQLDVLVNNAGVMQVMPFANAQTSDFEDSLATHFWGPYFLVRACLPHLLRSRGRIVNVASVGGRVAVPHLSPYTVGKFALVGFSESLRAELAPRGVSVTTVTPHVMQTGSHRNVLVRGQRELEAAWFALGASSRATAIPAERAARQIVRAARLRRAAVTPGWQARVATVANAVAPGAFAGAASLAARLLPAEAEAPAGNEGRMSRDLDVGAVAQLFPSDAARRLNQPLAADEAS